MAQVSILVYAKVTGDSITNASFPAWNNHFLGKSVTYWGKGWYIVTLPALPDASDITAPGFYKQILVLNEYSSEYRVAMEPRTPPRPCKPRKGWGGKKC